MAWLKARLLFLPTLFWNMLLGRWLKVRHWWDRIDSNVMLGALPFDSDVEKLAALDVKGVVNTCEEYRGPTSKYQEYGIEQFWIPTINYTHPKFADVCRAVAFIERQIEAGNSVYIHCKAGRGRSATVAICWLIKARQISKEEAQSWLTRHREFVNQKLTSRPVVQAFEKQFLKT